MSVNQPAYEPDGPAVQPKKDKRKLLSGPDIRMTKILRLGFLDNLLAECLKISLIFASGLICGARQNPPV